MSQKPSPTPDLSCHAALERQPWLLNGTLEGEERRALLDHLAACEGCQAELEATALVWQTLDQHVPSLALAELGLGAPLSGDPDRESIERHLAHCPSCRRELELIQSDCLVDFPSAARRQRSPAGEQAVRGQEAGRQISYQQHWRQMAVAAGLGAVIASGGWLWSQIETTDNLSDHGEGIEDRVPAEEAEPFGDGFESGSIDSWSSQHS